MPYKNKKDADAAAARSRRKNREKTNARAREKYAADPSAHKTRHARYILKDPDAHRLAQRRRWIKYNYGLSFEAFETMLLGQKNKCAICRKPFDEPLSASVDHCHETGRVRGLLCRLCNLALGHIQDDVDTAERLLAYVRNRC